MMDSSTASPALLRTTCFVMFLYIFTFGVLVPVVPEILLEETDQDSGKAVTYSGIILAIKYAVEFLFLPVLGKVSDRIGRKPVILLGFACSVVGWGIVTVFPIVATLAIASVLSGITNIMYPMSVAAITDTTAHRIRTSSTSSGNLRSSTELSSPEDNLAQNFGLVGVAFGLGFIFGPAIGGGLVSWTNSVQVPTAFASGMSAFAFLFVLFCYPETLGAANATKFTWSSANPLPFLRYFFGKPVLAMLGIPFMFSKLAGGIHIIWLYYLKTRYEFDTMEVGLFLSVVGALSCLMQGIGIRCIVPKLISEELATVAGTVIHLAGTLSYGFCTRGYQLYVVLGVTSISFISEPCLRAIMAQHVPAKEQGALQGALSSIYVLSMIAASGIYTPIYAYADAQEGKEALAYPFIFSTLCSLITAVTAAIAFKIYPSPASLVESEDPKCDLKSKKPALESDSGSDKSDEHSNTAEKDTPAVQSQKGVELNFV